MTSALIRKYFAYLVNVDCRSRVLQTFNTQRSCITCCFPYFVLKAIKNGHDRIAVNIQIEIFRCLFD